MLTGSSLGAHLELTGSSQVAHREHTVMSGQENLGSNTDAVTATTASAAASAARIVRISSLCISQRPSISYISPH